MAIAQNKVVELAQEEIANMVGFQTLAAIIGLDWRIGMDFQLPEGEVAELPAHVQQTLPDIQRQSDPFNRELAAVFQTRGDIAHVERRAKVFPAGR